VTRLSSIAARQPAAAVNFFLSFFTLVELLTDGGLLGDG
jgi:hypothetical protein